MNHYEALVKHPYVERQNKMFILLNNAEPETIETFMIVLDIAEKLCTCSDEMYMKLLPIFKEFYSLVGDADAEIKFIKEQRREMTATVDMIGFIQIGDDSRSINTTSLNLLQIVAEKHENASVLNYHELARYDTADRTRKVYDMFLDWLNADTGNTVFVFPIWDEEINDFNPSWNDQHKRQIPVV